MPEPRAKVQELYDESNRLVTEAQELTEGDFDQEAEERFNKLMDEASEVRQRAERIEGSYKKLDEANEWLDGNREARIGREAALGFDKPEDEREDRVQRIGGREVRRLDDPEVEERNERYRGAFWRYMTHGPQELSRDEIHTLKGGRYAPIDEKRAVLQVGTSNLGGVLAPEEFQAEFFEELKSFGGLRNIVRVVQTPHGRDLEWPTLADTGNQASLVSEASTIGSSPNSAMGLITYRAHKYQSGPFRLSREFMADSVMAAEPIARSLIATRLGRKTSFDYISSTGGGDRPLGLVNSSTDIAVSSTAGSTNPYGFAEIIDLIHSVDPAWRQNARFLMHDESLKRITKITDNDGQFLLQPRVTEGAPLMIQGYPVTIDNSSSDLKEQAGAVKKVIWFGDFSQFLIRDALQLVIRRLDERFALTDEVGFVGFMRTDAKLAVHSTTPNALRPIRALAFREST